MDAPQSRSTLVDERQPLSPRVSAEECPERGVMAAAWIPSGPLLLLSVMCLAGLAWARVDASVKSRLLSEAGMREDRVRELAVQGTALLRKKTHHYLIEKWGLPLLVAAKHMVPLWVAGTAAFLAVTLAHSPLSPLPVPPLPHAPVGRFPPRQTVLKVPTPVHVVTIHQAGVHRRRREATPDVATSLAHGDSLQQLIRWLRGEFTGVPNKKPLGSSALALRPAAQLALDALMRVQPVQVLRAALAVSAAYRVLRLVGSVVAGAAET